MQTIVMQWCPAIESSHFPSGVEIWARLFFVYAAGMAMWSKALRWRRPFRFSSALLQLKRRPAVRRPEWTLPGVVEIERRATCFQFCCSKTAASAMLHLLLAATIEPWYSSKPFAFKEYSGLPDKEVILPLRRSCVVAAASPASACESLKCSPQWVCIQISTHQINCLKSFL